MDNGSKLALLMSTTGREYEVDLVIEWLAQEGCSDNIVDALTMWANSPIVTAERWRQWTKAVEADKGWITTVRGC